VGWRRRKREEKWGEGKCKERASEQRVLRWGGKEGGTESNELVGVKEGAKVGKTPVGQLRAGEDRQNIGEGRVTSKNVAGIGIICCLVERRV